MSQNIFINSQNFFGWSDYAIFGIMLAICMVIGVYFDVQNRKKHKNANEKDSEALNYLLGGRKLQVFPVSISLVASALGGVAIVGTSTEIYLYGSQFALMIPAIFIVGIVLHIFIIPVFHKMQLTSIYEYFDRRFNRRMRIYGALLYLISTFLRTTVMIYVPALVFNQMANIENYITIPIVCLICIFYTCIGGMKAVIWTDVIQGLIMLGSLMIVSFIATYDAGGLDNVIQQNIKTNRIEVPDFTLDPTIRLTFWSTVIGGSFSHFAFSGLEQSMIQRYVSLPTVQDARKALWIFIFAYGLITGLTCYIGLLVHAIYADCDPFTAGVVKQPDQVVPLLVMDTLGRYPMINGLFVACVWSASLSTISSGLNSMAAVILEDFIKPKYTDSLTETSTGYILRGSVLIFGLASMGLAFICELLGPILGVAVSIPALAYGPLIGVFLIGLFMPWISSFPALIGAISGLTSTTFIVLKAQIDMVNGDLKYNVKSLSTEGCDFQLNSTEILQENVENNSFNISYLFHCCSGVLITILVANVLSFWYKVQDPSDIDDECLVPQLQKIYLKKKYKKNEFSLDENLNNKFIDK